MTDQNMRLTERSRYVSIQLFKTLEQKVPEALHLKFAELLKQPKHVIVSCVGVSDFSQEWIEAFQFVDSGLKSASKKMYFIFAKDQLLEKLNKPLKGKALTMVPDLYTALASLEAEAPPLDRMHYIKAFVAATLRTFYVQAQMRCTQGKIHFLDMKNPEKLLGDLSGLVLIEAGPIHYLLVLSFPKETFLNLMSTMRGESLFELTPEIADGATELLNIVFGQVKLVLNNRNAGIKPQIPVLVHGKNIPPGKPGTYAKALPLLEQGKTIVVPFDSSAGEFFVQVSFPEDLKASMLRSN